jgi:hypothetical protein
MIDSKFIIKYTNALYSTPAEYAPRYDEFRDMFSSGQVLSKEWAVNELKKLKVITTDSVIIVGSWFGTLGYMLLQEFPAITLKLLDIDSRCKEYVNNVMYNKGNVLAETGDMYKYPYSEQVVINTSCEHIADIEKWLRMLRKGSLVLLQSNNFFKSPDHINCVNSLDEFINQVNLETVLYKGELKTPMYTRYMIIGRI